MNLFWMAKVIGLLKLSREYNEDLKKYPDSFFCLRLVIVCEAELDRLLQEVDISGALEILKSDK